MFFIDADGDVDVDMVILRHRRHAHTGRRKDCPVCGVKFKAYTELGEHAQEEHPNEKASVWESVVPGSVGRARGVLQ